MRIFYGISLSEEEKEKCNNISMKLQQNDLCKRFVAKDNYHITLTFIGEVSNVYPFVEVLNKMSLSKFVLTSTQTLHSFGETLTIDFSPSSEIQALKQQLDLLLQKEALLPEQPRTFHPHITMGRRCETYTSSVETLSIRVKKIALFLSESDGSSVKYTVIQEKEV